VPGGRKHATNLQYCKHGMGLTKTGLVNGWEEDEKVTKTETTFHLEQRLFRSRTIKTWNVLRFERTIDKKRDCLQSSQRNMCSQGYF
jgi:hypothetical protein